MNINQNVEAAPERLSLQNILESRRYVKENGGMIFKSAEELFSPFIERVSSLNPTYHVKAADPKSVGDKNDVLETSYGKALIEAQIPLSAEETSTIGIVYSLTSNTPVIKVYCGPKVTACLNLCIWNADNVFTSSIMGSINNVYQQIDKYIDNLETIHSEYFARRRKMQEAMLSKEQYHLKLGEILEKSIAVGSVLGSSPVVNAARLIHTGKNYGFKNDTISEWDFCNAITDCLKNDSSLDKIPNKTLKAFELFEEVV